jgi:septal ring factor EnvC (AmiA/AmiB activator)
MGVRWGEAFITLLEAQTMSTSQLQQTMATLRMSLAEIQSKERQLDSMINQFRTQLRRLPRQVIYGRTPLEVSLSAMGEIEERLADALVMKRRLLTIKKAARDELAALESVKQVDEARRSLANLKRQILVSGEDAETLAEIRQLEQFIAEHSKRAEQAITASYQERHEGGQEMTEDEGRRTK